ncbi:MAG: hypothetical protein JSW11_07960 [Candidatus Heimdallarchaeota archaeon]|nr:MAG: hypothetical protein JSW11_07960 [Candidatus Heimdallarchaeota archaeon]
MKIVIKQRNESGSISIKPFNSFIILSPIDDVVLFFTQVFAEMLGVHPSVVSSTISLPSIQKFDLEIHSNETLGRYILQQFRKTSFNTDKLWVEELIHELRTASLTIDLGAHVLADNEHLAPVLLRKLLRASHRQKIATLIASDFLQLNAISPSIHPISLVKILTGGLSHSPFTSQVKFFLSSSIKTDVIGHVNPIIWGNFYFLSNFFTTLLSWFETELVTLEMKIINPVSVQVTMSIHEDHFLSDIQGFSLIPHYLQYIVAYFNGCSWVTQNSIKILFPLVLFELTLDKIYSLL